MNYLTDKKHTDKRLTNKRLTEKGPVLFTLALIVFSFITPLPSAEAQTEHTAQDLQNEVEQVYDTAHGAVAHITTEVQTTGMFQMPTPQEGSGSGFLYDEAGHVVTNYHVIENAESITVTLGEEQVYEASVTGKDPFSDLAVLKIEGNSLPQPLKMGNSDNINVGEFVIAMGNPFNFEQTLTFGVVSALGRMVNSPRGGFISEAIQTDTPINPGNSGGPLIDLDGEVVGVNSAIISPSGASAGIGFAISSNTVRDVVPALIEDGHYPHPWLGVQAIDITPSLANMLEQAEMDIPVEEGVLVVQVMNNAPADNVGIRGGRKELRLGNMRLPVGGDIITAIDGKEITKYKELIAYMRSEAEIGEEVEVTLYRNDRKITKELEVGERPRQNARR